MSSNAAKPASTSELIVFGYIREMNMDIPIEIIRLCDDFYPFYEYVQFTRYKKETSESLDNFTRIKAVEKVSCNKLFIAEVGYNSGFHQWKIKCIQSAGNFGIGMVQCSKDATDPWQNGANWLYDGKFLGTYYWFSSSKNGGRVQYYCDGASEFEHQTKSTFISGDIAIICLDCNNWTVEFQTIQRDSDEIQHVCQTIDIKKECKYFPALCFCRATDEFVVQLN